MMAAGNSKRKAMIRYLKFCLRLDVNRFLLFLEIRADNTIAPKLSAAASPMMRAGSSKIP